MQKNIIIGAIILIVGVIGTIWYFSLNDGKKWLLFNKNDAEIYAKKLLAADKNIATPDKFVDYVIVANKHYVIFTPHSNPYISLGYFPKSHPKDYEKEVSKLEWIPIQKGWYQHKSITEKL